MHEAVGTTAASVRQVRQFRMALKRSSSDPDICMTARGTNKVRAQTARRFRCAGRVLRVLALRRALRLRRSALSAPHRSPAQENLFGVKTQATISPCRVDMQRKKAVREMELVSSAPSRG